MSRCLAMCMLCFVTLLVMAPTAAAADDSDPKREPQNYGAPKEDTDAGDVALWVPRVALFPLYLTSEYLIRRPVGALVKVAEKNDWAQEAIELFTFGERKQLTIFPSALFDFGLLPSVGFNAQLKYFIADPNTLRVHFGFWGFSWISARVVDKYDFGHRESVTADASIVRRQDNPFYGMGPRSPQVPRYRYQSATSEASLAYERRGWRESAFSVQSGVRSVTFGDGTCCQDPSIDDGIADKSLASPPGYRQDYLLAFQRLALTLDSRKPRPVEGSGIRVEAHGESDFAPETGNGNRAWIRYGGSAGGAVDLTRNQRVVSLTVDAEFAEPLTGTIPFTEQVALGGDVLMRGYLRNRLIDRSALVATLQYTWPIWVYLDGVIHADIGNVFGSQLDGIEAKLMRMTAGIGFRSNGSRDAGFEVLVAGGTDPFEDGFKVDSFRLVIGSHHGF